MYHYNMYVTIIVRYKIIFQLYNKQYSYVAIYIAIAISIYIAIAIAMAICETASLHTEL